MARVSPGGGGRGMVTGQIDTCIIVPLQRAQIGGGSISIESFQIFCALNPIQARGGDSPPKVFVRNS